MSPGKGTPGSAPQSDGKRFSRRQLLRSGYSRAVAMLLAGAAVTQARCGPTYNDYEDYYSNYYSNYSRYSRSYSDYYVYYSNYYNYSA